MKRHGLTPRQEKFIELYQGNGTRAAKQAGYTGDPNTLAKTAHDLLKDTRILEAIRARRDAEIAPAVLTRTERQKFWSEVVTDPLQSMADRLRASELLGKSQADFKERVDISMDIKVGLAERLRRARLKHQKADAPLELTDGSEVAAEGLSLNEEAEVADHAERLAERLRKAKAPRTADSDEEPIEPV